MGRWLFLLVAFGCTDVVLVAPPPDLEPTIGIDPDVADLALSAVTLWSDATGGLYAPTVHLGCLDTDTLCLRETDGMIDACGESGTFRGCYSGDEIELSEAMAYDQKTGTIAHELGHALGLEHQASGLMNPTRPVAERHLPCVDAVTLGALAALGVPSGGFAPRCYDEAVFRESLSLLDKIATSP